jgi:hypothetical protein
MTLMATQELSTHVMGVAQFERFFRTVASLDIDKDDIKRFDDFVNERIHALLVRAQANAKANIRDVIEPQDLPITKGLQERIIEFRKTNEEIALQPILERLTILPRLDMACSPETEAELPSIAGGVAVALAHVFKLMDTGLKNPWAIQWERASRLFDLLL